jgi:5,10-methylenetetrahydromethanopterin reductase
MAIMTPSSSPVPRLGVAYVPYRRPEDLHDLATSAEAAGLDEIWVWEDCFKQSGIASAAAALAWTSTVRVGIGLLPVPLRNVAVTAMEIATLARLFPGRLVAGIGHGVQEWMDQVGARASSPMTLLSEYATALGDLLAGDEVTVHGRYVRLDRVKLDWPPAPAPPLMIGGTGPRTIALAARLGDGNLLPAAMTDEEVGATVAIIRTSLADRPRSASHEVVATQLVATGEGAQERIDTEVPNWGRPPGMGIGAAGDADAVAGTLRRLMGAGVTSVVVQPTQDEPDLGGLIEFVGRQVKPLLALA